MVLSLLLISFQIGRSQQDLTKNYSPLTSSGTLPKVFTENTREVVDQEIAALKKANDDKLDVKKVFVESNNYQIRRIIRSGNVLFNDEVTTYLNKVVDEILRDDPQLRSKINIYTFRSSVVNAYSFDKGYIFIDLGLIAQLETEAQLAFVLCHEIAHFTKQHSINSYIKKSDHDNEDDDRRSIQDRLVERTQYSKELESEADLEGYKMFLKTKYSLKQALKGFDVLQYAYLPFELIEFKFSFFETHQFKIPKKYQLERLREIRDRSKEDDSESTHPNAAKRKQDLAKLMSGQDQSKGLDFINNKAEFFYIRDVSRIETCRMYLRQRDYGNAVYGAYILLQKYPENQYLLELMAKSLYGISLYNTDRLDFQSDNAIDSVAPMSQIESYPQQLYHLINKMSPVEWNVLSLNYVYRKHLVYPENKVLAVCADSLFDQMNHVDWQIDDFRRFEIDTSKKADTPTTEMSKTDIISQNRRADNTASDSVYYKNTFVDLFVSDKKFSAKFPLVKPYVAADSSNAINSEKNRLKKVNKINLSLKKVLLLEPVFYDYKVKNKEEIVDYVKSDLNQELLTKTILQSSKVRNLEVIPFDTKLISSNEIEKLNDISILNDWLIEKQSSSQLKSHVLSADLVKKITDKYGTSFALKMGIINVKSESGKKRIYIITLLYDLSKNEIVYGKYEVIRKRMTKDLLYAKTYQILFELTNKQKS